jgi:hypothetical protein
VSLKTDTTPPAIKILSPENGQTYPPDNIPLTFYVNTTTSHTWYALDGYNFTISGNATLPTLVDGEHNITVYAQDNSHNTGASNPVYFTSQTITFTIDSNVAPAPQTTSNNSQTKNTEPLQTITLIAAMAIAIVAVCVALILYKKSTPKELDKQGLS